MLNKKQHEMIKEIEGLDLDTPAPALDVIGLKLMALQTVLMNDMASELMGIERSLERLAAKDFR